jgi:hypothetical protein
MTHEYCGVWSRARDIAQDRGLEMDLTCPLEELCKIIICPAIEEDTKDVLRQTNPSPTQETK